MRKSNNRPMTKTNRVMNVTSTNFSQTRSLMSSQYTNRKLLASQGIHRRCKNSAIYNHISKDIPTPGSKNVKFRGKNVHMSPEIGNITMDYGMSEMGSNGGSPKMLMKKTQKIKYTMDELKLTCNKTTFMKFYDLKSKVANLQKLYANVTKIKSHVWKPQVREECTLDIVSGESGVPKGYLVNGFNGDGIKQIVQLSIYRKPKPLLDWKTISVSNFDKMHSKFGQATCVDEEYIYISGGAEACLKNANKDEDRNNLKKVLSSQKLNISRQCTSELVRFNTIKHEITLLPRGNYIVSPKRDHCIAKFGRFIIAFGGINDLGRVLDDLDIYDTEFGYWHPLKTKNPIEGV